MTDYRANYALCSINEYLGPDEGSLDLSWATFGGNRTSEYEFSVPVEDVTDVYVELQAYDVGAFGHEIVLNGEALGGFDIPPGSGWQYWMDSPAEMPLQAGENTLCIRRDEDSRDAFAIGTVVVNWKEVRESE